MQNSKTFTIFAGINGAGKSTLFAAENGAEDLGMRLNPDEVLQATGKDWRDTQAQIEAAKKVIRLQRELLQNEISFNQETTLSGTSIFNAIYKAKKLGYKIHLRYVGVADPDIAKERVAKRIALGGHGVSPATIDRRYGTAKENFIKIYPYCDSVNIYDNSGTKLILVAYTLNGKIIRTDAPCQWADEYIASIKR